ncbi:MAG: ABC transporter substrate-binding protein [Thermomicrobiales bacterium]|nr:ABC transporter substrate-binding protein [Thermomicrobiales bacterium]
MRISRRRALTGLAGLGALSLAGSPARAQDATPSAAGAWTFTDDAGKTVSLPEPPRRVVADLNAASALWDFGVRPVAVSGWTIASDAAWGNVDRETPVINADAAAPEPDLEMLLEIQPDLFVTVLWGDEDTLGPYAWSFTEPENYERVNDIVPVVGIFATGLADRNMERFAELAGLLGADLESPELLEAKEAYEQRVAQFSAQTQAHPELTALFAHASGEGFSVANPEDWADLSWFRTLGLNIIEPDIETGTFWEFLSAEQAGTYQPDILFVSQRDESFTLEDLPGHPLYGMLPAVKAGQIGPWNQDMIQSYQGLEAALSSMLATLENAQKVTG